MAADHLVRGSCVGVCIFVVMVVISVVIETMSIIIIRRNKKKYTPTAPMQVGWGGVSRSANLIAMVSAVYREISGLFSCAYCPNNSNAFLSYAKAASSIVA